MNSIFYTDVRCDAAARRKSGLDLHPPGFAGPGQIVQNLIGQGLIEYTLIAIALHIEL